MDSVKGVAEMMNKLYSDEYERFVILHMAMDSEPNNHKVREYINKCDSSEDIYTLIYEMHREWKEWDIKHKPNGSWIESFNKWLLDDYLGWYAKDKVGNLFQFQWQENDDLHILKSDGKYYEVDKSNYEIINLKIITERD